MLLRCVENEGCCAEGYNCSIFNEQALAVAKNAVHYECAGNALVVTDCVCEFARIIPFYIYYAVAAVHTGVACLNGVRDYCALVIAAEHVVAFAKRNNLLVAECVLYDCHMAEIFGMNIFIAFANAYCETLAAVLALKYKSLALLVAACIEINCVVAFGTDYFAHAGGEWG